MIRLVFFPKLSVVIPPINRAHTLSLYVLVL